MGTGCLGDDSRREGFGTLAKSWARPPAPGVHAHQPPTLGFQLCPPNLLRAVITGVRSVCDDPGT